MRDAQSSQRLKVDLRKKDRPLLVEMACPGSCHTLDRKTKESQDLDRSWLETADLGCQSAVAMEEASVHVVSNADS